MEIIAEVGQAHDGSLGILHSYIDALSETGVDTVKFQIHIAEAESSVYEQFRVNFSYEDATRFDYWKRMSFTFDQWAEIKAHVEEKGMEFLATPFSVESVDWMERLNVKRYKIGSGDTNNLLLLKKVAETGKPIILSSGMSTFEELDVTIEFLSQPPALSILQCTTEYPTSASSLGLNVIGELKKKYPKYTIGFSDHSGLIHAGIAAATLGAEIIEAHVVFDKRMFGPDSKSSLSIEEFSELVSGANYVHQAINSPVNKASEYYDNGVKKIFSKAISAKEEIIAGSIISLDDLECKKPFIEGGISTNEFERLIGSKASRDIPKYEFIKTTDVK